MRSEEGAEGLECFAWSRDVRRAADGRIAPFRSGNPLQQLKVSAGRELLHAALGQASAPAFVPRAGAETFTFGGVRGERVG